MLQEQGFFTSIPLYLGSFGWRNTASEGTEGRGRRQKTIVWFLPGLSAVCLGSQTWQFSNRKCQLIRAIAWHGRMIAAVPLAGLQRGVTLRREAARFDGKGSVSLSRQDSLVG